MATRSLIGLQKGNKVKFIYCHYDGYIKDGVGETLYTHYQNVKDIEKLLALGDLSSLGPIPKSNPKVYTEFICDGDRCQSYRDRGEKHVDAKECYAEDYPAQIGYWGVDYLYLYRDGEWFVYDEDGEDDDIIGYKPLKEWFPK